MKPIFWPIRQPRCSLNREKKAVVTETIHTAVEDVNMLDSSDDDIEVELDYNMSDEEYDLYYHNELFVEYNSPPTPKRVYNPDLAPITLLICNTIQGRTVERLLVISLDGGSSGSLIKKRAIPKRAVATKSDRSHMTTTASGSFDTSLTVGVQKIRLPEFSNNRKVEGWNLRIFDSTTCQYDMIIGRDFMQHIGIDNFFTTDTIRWIDRSVKLKPPHHYYMMALFAKQINENYEDGDALSEAFAKLYEVTILDRAYKKVTPTECTNEQVHMLNEEQVKFEAMLERHKIMFDGELGLYPHEKFNLKVKEGAVPVHKKPYPVPHKRRNVFCCELKNLVKDGVLKPCDVTQWASPTFIIPKPESSTVRWVSDFRELNKVLERTQYPLPRIQDIMLKQRGYRHFTKIDISMMFYCFELEQACKELCTIITLFGKFQYQQLPMGIKVSRTTDGGDD